MDLLAQKLALPRPARWPGSRETVLLAPLPPAAIQAADREGDELGELAPMGRALAVVARALGADRAELAKAVGPAELGELYRAWEAVQAGGIDEEDGEGLRDAIRRAVHLDPDVQLDGAAAWNAHSAAEFYGRPHVELTAAQLAYYLVVRAAYQEFFVPDEHGNVKQVTRQWLEKRKHVG